VTQMWQNRAVRAAEPRFMAHVVGEGAQRIDVGGHVPLACVSQSSLRVTSSMTHLHTYLIAVSDASEQRLLRCIITAPTLAASATSTSARETEQRSSGLSRKSVENRESAHGIHRWITGPRTHLWR